MPSVGSAGISFSGITTPIAVEMTSGYGTAPSAGVLRFREQPKAPRFGNLTIDCDGEKRTWRDCKLQTFQRLTDAANRGIVVAQVLDRRWRWQGIKISGKYNLKRARGGYQTGTEKTPRELATLLFKALGEPGADVSALPNESRPEINWDVAGAANELATLCETLACRVVLGNDDKPRIVRLGTGRALQDSPTAFALGESLNTPDPPDVIKLVGGWILYQCRLKLVAVGVDIGGVIRPIDNLSYKPTTGWEKESPSTLGGVVNKEVRDASGQIENTKQLALSSVYRMYQLAEKGHEITDEIKDVERPFIVIPSQELAEKYIDELGIERRRAAFCAGVWCTETKPDGKNSKDDAPVVTYSAETMNTDNLGFSVDSERWLVQFNEPVFKRTSDENEIEPADIYLVCAVAILDKDTRGPQRFEKTLKLGRGSSGSTVTETIVREDVVKRVVTQYQTSGAIKGTEVLDETNLEKRADYYLDAQKQIYLPQIQQEVQYKGIVNISVDGLVQQVTWSGDTDRGAETRASQGFEANRNVPTYDEWRRRQKVAENTKK